MSQKKEDWHFGQKGIILNQVEIIPKKIHWPGNSLSCWKDHSGATIGRGFDLGDRHQTSVLITIKKAGIENKKAEAISKGAKKKGCLAYNFVLENRESIEEITDIQQLRLFEITYTELEKDVERISKLHKNIRDYHSNLYTLPDLAWENIPDKIKEVLIDLRYRGDYTPQVRELIQKMAYEGDIEGFGKAISNRSFWIKLPNDRFNRRVEYYEKN